MSFWHHDLGRKITVTNNPITGQPGGRLIEFINAMSLHFLTEAERTPAAIGSFIRTNKSRVVSP